jgi:hypothetical protein
MKWMTRARPKIDRIAHTFARIAGRGGQSRNFILPAILFFCVWQIFPGLSQQ